MSRDIVTMPIRRLLPITLNIFANSSLTVALQALQLWEQSTEAIVKRESVLEALALLEAKVSE